MLSLIYCTGCRGKRTIDAFPGSYSGVGIELEIQGNTPVVIRTIKGSAAERAGIIPGEVLVAIDGEHTSGQSLADIVDRIRGPDGTLVRLTLQGHGKNRTVSLKRGKLDRTDFRNRSGEGYKAEGNMAVKGQGK